MAQCVMSAFTFVVKARGLEFKSSVPMEKPGMAACTSNTSVEKQMGPRTRLPVNLAEIGSFLFTAILCL